MRPTTTPLPARSVTGGASLKEGTGTLVVTNNNTTATTTISGGTVQVGRARDRAGQRGVTNDAASSTAATSSVANDRRRHVDKSGGTLTLTAAITAAAQHTPARCGSNAPLRHGAVGQQRATLVFNIIANAITEQRRDPRARPGTTR
jgi:autotransporter-associated beta strand protein